MKSLPPGLQAHLSCGTTTLCWCWKTVRGDALVQGFTDHDEALAFDGVTYQAASGFTASEVQSTLGLAVGRRFPSAEVVPYWAAQIVVRYGLDVMFDIQFALWGDVVLPGTKKLKEQYLGITGNTVADWMKDLQLDATALPGKAFDLSFEMPEDEERGKDT